jgi:ketosteroid isomerase-like protein
MSTARQLSRLNEQYIQGLINADARWFEEHLADEFICIEADGAVRTKPDFVRKVSNGAGYAKYRLEQVQVRVFGDVGLVQATGVFTRPDGGTGMSRYTDVYAREGSAWKVVSAQITRVEGGADAASEAGAAA